MDPKLTMPDPLLAPLRRRLEHHYREFFPGLVKDLEERGGFRAFLGRKEELYLNVHSDQVANNVHPLMAEQVAYAAAFAHPGPAPEQ